MTESALRLIEDNKRTKETFLDLGYCGLRYELPKELSECVWLEKINLGYYYRDANRGNWIASKNDKSDNVFHGNELTILENLPKLRSLDLSTIKIQAIYFLQNLTQLTSLNLRNNQIQDISPLQNLTLLTSLDLDSNQIQDVRFLQNLTQLQYLYLGSNEIQHVQFLENLNQLVCLYLNNNNQIRDYSYLQNLTQLQTLNLNSNQIKDISFLQNLTKIHYLDLYNNQIQDISFLKKLKQLQYLDLSYNQINDIGVLSGFSKLSYLEIDSTPVESKYNLNLPLNQNHWNIIKNILDREKEETDSFPIKFPVKIILLGNHSSGKSSLLHFLLSDNLGYHGNSTHILNVESSLDANNIPKAVFYDFGGQDYYHGIYRAFLSIGSVYFLLWDKKTNANTKLPDKDNIPTQNFSLNYWLAQKNYHLRNAEDPIFIIQTHALENENPEYHKIPSDELVHNLFYISLHNDFNPPRNQRALKHLQACLDELIEFIQTERAREEPKWYVDFYKYILSEKEEDSITLKDLLPRYTPQGKNEKERLDSLKVELEQFHNQGLVLYYQSINKNKVWLNPTRLVSHIHTTILKKELLTKSKGIVPKEKFDSNDDEILLLLEKQKVIFKLESGDYIIPNFLPLAQDNQSEYDLLTFGLINPRFTLRFKNFLPMGLINQLICFFGQQLNYKKFWRDQLLFTFEEKHKILINLDFNSLQIKVFFTSITTISKTEKDQLNHYLFYVIMAMYWDFEPLTYNELNELMSVGSALSTLEELNKKPEQYKELFEEKRLIPDDLYISIDIRHWVKLIDLSDQNIGERAILSYYVQDQEIIARKNIPIKPFEVFTNKQFDSMKKIFISYSKFDEDYKNELQEHLITLKRENFVEVFDDRQLELGSKWDDVLKQKIDECDYFICLVSRSFLNVPYIYEEEMPRAFKEGKKIIPIIIKPCDWEHTPINNYNDTDENPPKLGHINAHNKAKVIGLNESYINLKGQAEIRAFTEIERDAMWLEVVKKIRNLIRKDS